MDKLTEARRAVLRQFVKNCGGFKALEVKFGLTPSLMSYLSQLLGRGSRAPFGERSARNWETRLGIEGSALVRPGPMATSVESLPRIDITVADLGEILNAIPLNQRSKIAALIGIFAKKPLPEIQLALIALLKDGVRDITA